MMSVTAHRKIQCHPPPKYHALIRAYAEVNEFSVSEAGNHAIKELIDKLPPDQKEKVEKAAKKYQSKNIY